jgi:hypothetical protein
MPQQRFAFFAPLRLGVRLRNAVLTENEIAKEIVDAAFRIHATLGPGLLGSVYDAVLAHELGRRGLRIARLQPIPVIYDNVRIDIGFRADLIVEDKSWKSSQSRFSPRFTKSSFSRTSGWLTSAWVEDETHAKPPSRKDA